MNYKLTREIASKIYLFSLATAAFTMPFYRGATNVSLFIALLAWLVAYGLPNPLGVMRLVVANKSLWPVIGLYVIAVVGLSYSDHLDLGLNKLETILPTLVFPIMLSGAYSHPHSFRVKVLDAFIMGILAASLVCLVSATYLTVLTGSSNYRNPENGVIENFFFYHRLAVPLDLLAVYFAFFLTFAVLVLFQRLFRPGTTRSKRYGLLGIILYLLCFLILLESANLTIALAISLLLMATYKIIHLGKEYKRVKVYLGTGVLIVALLSGYIAYEKVGANPALFRYDITEHPPGHWNPINLRLALWDQALILIRDNWLVGVGTGSIGPYLDQIYRENEFYFAVEDQYHPHNQFLYSIAAWGLPGLLVFLAMLLMALRISILRKDALLFGLTWIYFQFSFTESTLVISKGIVFFYFFLSLLVFTSYKPKIHGRSAD